MKRMTVPELETPALVIDLDAMDWNLKRMAEFFAPMKCKLRPHVKTHKCTEIAHRQMKLGAIGITCAKLGEAEVMADGGIKDILIANQIVGEKKINRLVELACRAMITVAVDDIANAREIAKAAYRKGTVVGVLVEVDIGMGRCGILADDAIIIHTVKELVRMSGLRFRGLMGYEGHAVLVEDMAERRAKAEAAVKKLWTCLVATRRAGIDVEVVSAGGTGTYDITSQMKGVSEIQAGSYVFMDARYRRVKPEFKEALFVVATVVSRPTSKRVILDAGMKSVSHEFGLPSFLDPVGLTVLSLSEEHIKCETTGTCELKPGDQVWLLPFHCCTTINLHDRYWCLREGKVTFNWPIEARGKFT